ncbi:glycosyl hydrolase family 3 N terminal domain-containing protein [Xylariomycetidae sp. FL0641]|nr:glycosyl hydrolase family 3 N terminal domain-containing protein [Xylariomycetidae sp. FL0641]
MFSLRWAWLLAGLGASAQDIIQDDTFFYGQSPPVYPTPETPAQGAWADSVTKARNFVGQLTLEEKVNLTGGVTSQTGCSGFIPAIPRLDFPGICLTDSGNGLRGTDYVTGWPSGIHVGASWNKDLAYDRSFAMGNEARIKGVQVLLGPVIGPVGRVVEGGRNWEGFSVDPYLAGSLVYEAVSGMQDAGVTACTKHFIGNEQETHRVPTQEEPIVQALSSNIDDKTMHELYLWAWYDAVKAGTGSVMCSYNRLNNSYGCGNSKTQNGLLKGELGFAGFVVSDWNAQTGGLSTALAGMDAAMPSGDGFWGGNLTLAVRNGSVPEARVDDMATRILASWYQMRQDAPGLPAPGVGMPADINAPHEKVDARNTSARPVAFDGAVEGHVLVKNTHGALPFASEKMGLISVFGYSATAPRRNNPGAPVEGQSFGAWAMGASSANATELNLGFLGNLTIPKSATAPNGTLLSGGGSGATSATFVSAPFDALAAQAYADGTQLFWDFESEDPTVVPTSDACLVVGNAWATEGYDRPGLGDAFTDRLIENVAGQCANTVVVFHNAGTRLVDAFVDHPNVTAIIFAHLPGQDSGAALVELLYGRANPSGRLPYTVARAASDYGRLQSPDAAAMAADDRFARFPQSEFSEGVFVDYRHFDAAGIAPRYEFGFGLSYTTFDYANLGISKAADVSVEEYPQGEIQEGGQSDLWDVLATVTADVRNAGARDGKEVAQLYLGLPGADVPVRQLRGFEKKLIPAGATATVEFPLTRRDLSVWDTAAQKWRLQAGDYKVFVGRSSRDLPLTGTLTI